MLATSFVKECVDRGNSWVALVVFACWCSVCYDIFNALETCIHLHCVKFRCVELDRVYDVVLGLRMKHVPVCFLFYNKRLLDVFVGVDVILEWVCCLGVRGLLLKANV